MPKSKSVATNEILLMLCDSVTGVLSSATDTHITHSAMVQKINKTCLKPDIGCFVLFDGGFSGLIIINFTATAALELYHTYLSRMGIPTAELAMRHTSDEVGNVLGELMNQIVGDFTGKVGRELHTPIDQNQPKMLTINKEVVVSINANLDRPQARRVTFRTAGQNIFYLEFAVDKTEFLPLRELPEQKELDPDRLIEQARAAKGSGDSLTRPDPDLLTELGL